MQRAARAGGTCQRSCTRHREFSDWACASSAARVHLGGGIICTQSTTVAGQAMGGVVVVDIDPSFKLVADLDYAWDARCRRRSVVSWSGVTTRPRPRSRVSSMTWSRPIASSCGLAAALRRTPGRWRDMIAKDEELGGWRIWMLHPALRRARASDSTSRSPLHKRESTSGRSQMAQLDDASRADWTFPVQE